MRLSEGLRFFVLIFVCTGAAVLVPKQAVAQFNSSNVSLHAWLDLSALGGGNNGNDCWGYTSPSGREYALMGVSDKLVVVEITTPSSPVIVGSVSHSNSTWCDVKVYQDHCYVVNEAGGGIDVVDLSDVDNGNVTLVQRFTQNGISTSHNIAINESSGFAYLGIPNINGGRVVALDLSTPATPVVAGEMTIANGGSAQHDAQIVTYTSGPNAGKEILFGAATGLGLDIIDVTNKSNMFRISRTTYANLAYCHQVWTEDLTHLYVNDESDGIPRTTVFDISDLTNPVVAGEFSSGLSAIDHNNYVRNGFVYEANYRSGLRIFDANVDPINPPEVGWFDTYPADDGSGFDGAWGVYPFFPSGTVIVSDIDRGLFILDVSCVTIPVGPCCGDGSCDPGEDCNTCSNDCISGSGSICGNGVCEPGEDCTTGSCPDDCRGQQGGRPSNRFCCSGDIGGGGGDGATDCNDPVCTSDGWACSFSGANPFCCGNGVCESGEDSSNCAIDCACTVPSDCDDTNECTVDDCVSGVCQNPPVADNTSCNAGADICCGGTCTTAACDVNADCDDGEACTTDTCLNGGTCSASCDSTPPCQNGDGCCPPGCNAGNDDDCVACGGQNAPCTMNDDCCSGLCRSNGKC
ncbi:MAG: choice-of-anchor B family protein, partial [Planctomycetes bacterium]|nr:choice-of-anchor B family protein [Planctomycetota bacterium]